MTALEQLEALLSAAGYEPPLVYQETSDAYTHIVREGPEGRRFVNQYSQDTSGKSEARARLHAEIVNRLPALLACARALEKLRAAMDTEWVSAEILEEAAEALKMLETGG